MYQNSLLFHVLQSCYPVVCLVTDVQQKRLSRRQKQVKSLPGLRWTTYVVATVTNRFKGATTPKQLPLGGHDSHSLMSDFTMEALKSMKIGSLGHVMLSGDLCRSGATECRYLPLFAMFFFTPFALSMGDSVRSSSLNSRMQTYG